MQVSATKPITDQRSLPLRRLMLVAIALIVAVASGCSRLRLPAIDPTGARLFAPLPTTTTLALPGSAGEGVGIFRGLGKRLRWPRFQLPKPAFSDPATPPACLTPAPITVPQNIGSGIASNEPSVASPSCSGECKDGPPAVLLGRETQMQNLLNLPRRGERGCILLTPQKIVAPVGGEVILLSGICGTDGYLQMGEPLEWMLTPESVGTFIQVGDDGPGLAHRLARIQRSEKKDPSYAHGVTSTKRTLITRGNLNPQDDVQLEKGETWISISSPSEGTSRVTVLAPESECWDNRKATATIYWIDARWQYPGPEILAAGTPASLTTRVTRSEGTLPARGWKVRYEILQPELATFAGTNGSTIVEVNVDDGGNATAQLIPNPGTSGITPVDIQVIRPGGVDDNMPAMTLSRGQTFVTWSAPQLAIRAGAPEIATFNVPVQVAANVSNPGDQPVDNVIVSVQIPQGAQAVSPDPFAQNLPSTVVWEIGTIPPQSQIDLFLDVTAQAPTQLTFQARGDGGLVAEDQVRIDVFQPSISLSVQPEKDRYEAGQSVTFNVDIKNTGDRPLTNLILNASGGEMMVHQEKGTASVSKPKGDGPLQPGEDWLVAVTFVPTESGRRCINVEATADGGQKAQSQSCVTVINPVPPTPAMNLKISGQERIQVGDTVRYLGNVTNTGQVPLTNLRVTMSYDPQLKPLRSTTDYPRDDTRLGQYLLAWTVPTLEPGKAALLEGEFQAEQTNARSQIIMTARSDEGATANDTFDFTIFPGAAPRPREREPGPTLPPVQPPPTVPGGPAPIPADPNAGLPAEPRVTAPPARSQQLQLTLSPRANPVRVNDEISYALTVTNDSTVPDNQVSMRFKLPPGVSIVRVVPRGSPELGQTTNRAGVTYLADIRTMRPGESIVYEVVLTSNQPQTIDLVVEAVSERSPNGTNVSAQTTVVP